MSFWVNVFLGKCLSGQISFWANVFWVNVFLGKCLSGQMSFWANVFLGKCISGQMSFGQMSSGQMSFWANVFLGKCLLGKCLLGKCLSGQMSFWANVFWANVHLGKCLSGQMSSGQMSFWANVSGQMSFWANVVWANVVSPQKRATFSTLNVGLAGTGIEPGPPAWQAVALIAQPSTTPYVIKDIKGSFSSPFWTCKSRKRSKIAALYDFGDFRDIFFLFFFGINPPIPP
jgi:hypothetical protein